MGKAIELVVKTETIHLHRCIDGFWLYDETRGMNLSMKAKSGQDAFIEALEYYQERLTLIEQQYNDLCAKVDDFVSLFDNKD